MEAWRPKLEVNLWRDELPDCRFRFRMLNSGYQLLSQDQLGSRLKLECQKLSATASCNKGRVDRAGVDLKVVLSTASHNDASLQSSCEC